MPAGNNNNGQAAAYQAQYSSMFLGAPLTKLVAALTVIAYVSINTKRASSVFDFNAARIRERGEAYRYFSSQLTFTSNSELVVGIILLSFLLRKFEREMGTRKMTFFCLFVLMATIATEVFLVKSNFMSFNLQYGGPYPLIGALFSLYHKYTPRLHPRFFSVLGINFSEKIFHYIWLVQVASADGWNTTYAVAIGWFVALLYELVPFLKKLDVPDFFADFLGDLSSRLLEAPPRLLVPQPVRGGGRAYPRAQNAAAGAGGGVRPTAAAQRPPVAPDPSAVAHFVVDAAKVTTPPQMMERYPLCYSTQSKRRSVALRSERPFLQTSLHRGSTMTVLTLLVHAISCVLVLCLCGLPSTVQAADDQATVVPPSLPLKKNLKNVMFHVLGTPHTIIREDFSPCAFTMKISRLCLMLKSLGLKTILYANEGSVHECDKLEVIFDDKERQQYFVSDESWKSGGNFDVEKPEGRAAFSERVTKAVNRNRNNESWVDMLLATYGFAHYDISQATGLTTIEVGVGYTHSFAKYRVYESYSNMHCTTAWSEQINNYHAVIPYCFYPSEFEGAKPFLQGSRYLAFIGRLAEDKGLRIVLAIMEHMPEDYTLHVAGQGNFSNFVPEGHPLYDRVIYHGVLEPKERNDILLGAEALLAPTTYREPFGAVMVEAQMLGTPVITTDHSAFVETIWHGVTGYRCRTLRCFVSAAKQAHLLDRSVIAKRARETYSCDVTKFQYEDYFQDVLNLWGAGWYDLDSGPGHTLDQKSYPRLVDGHLESQDVCESNFH